MIGALTVVFCGMFVLSCATAGMQNISGTLFIGSMLLLGYIILSFIADDTKN